MSYPGNPNLSQDLQQRISSTFQQALTLVSQAREQEAVRGCELILHSDPLHRPTQQLLKRLQSDQRPIVTHDLLSSPAPVQQTASSPPMPDVDLAMADGDLDDLDDLASLDDLGDLDDLGEFDQLGIQDTAPPPPKPAPQAQPPAPSPAPTSSAASGLATVLQDLLERRNFKQVLQIAESQRSTVLADPGLQTMVQTAQERLESEPYVQTFLDSAVKAWAEGLLADAEGHLEKARALDPSHPQIASLSAQVATGPKPAAPADDDLLSLDEEMPPLILDEAASAAPTGDEVPPMDAFSDDLADDLALEQDPVAGEDLDDLLDDLAPPQTDSPPQPPPASLSTPAPESASTDEGEIVMGFEEDDAGSAIDSLDSDEDGGERVSQLLAEGQEELERGEYQAAINIWSRIFLIELDNQEASQRIEIARKKKAELERRAEELFHEGIDHLEKSALEEAKTSFRQVLELDSSHALAQEYLEQLEAGQVPTVASRSDLSDLDLPPGVMDPEALQAGIMPDEKSMDAAVQRDRITVVKKTDKRLILIGAAVLLLVVAAAAFLVTKWKDLFPNATAPANAGVQQIDPIARATKMHEDGNTANAIILLEKILPIDPLYERAQALVAQWKALVEEPPQEDTGPPAEEIKRRNLLLTAGRDAHASGQYIRAQKYMERANRILPLEAEDLALKRDCDKKLEPLADEMMLFQQADYAKVIPELWRQREEAPGDPNIELLLVDSYYNLALRDLQRGNPAAAAGKLADALIVDPGSEELERLLLLSKTYTERPPDLLFRILVKYLPSRG